MDDRTARLAAEAMRKRQAGRRPNKEEGRALKRVERDHEEQQRREYYRTVSQKHIREMTGRQTKQLDDLARDHGIPINGKTVDVGAALRAAIDIIFANPRLLRDTISDDPLIEGASQSLKDEYVRQQILEKKEKAIIAREERRRIQGRTIHLDELRVFFAEAVPLLRDTGERMQRAGHDDAHTMLNEALDSLETLIDSQFPDGNSDPS